MSWSLFGTGCARISSARKTRPTLWKLAHEGVVFRNHHAVYPSATNVNGTALVTGVYPGQQRYDRKPRLPPGNRQQTRPSTSRFQQWWRKEMNYPAENIFRFRPSPRSCNARVGARRLPPRKTVGLLLDRQVDPGHAKNCVTLFAGQSRPREALNPIVDALGPFPPFGQFTAGRQVDDESR